MENLEAFRSREFLQREARLQGVKRQALVKTDTCKRTLHIVYVMTHVGICGGTKIVLEHANHLTAGGQHVTIVSHFDRPGWFPIDPEVSYIQVPFEVELAKGIPACDVIVATYWREISECVLRNIAPVIYFEQGDYHLFAWQDVPKREKAYIYAQFQLAPFIYTVSHGAAEQIRSIFHREADILNNAVDEGIFFTEESREAPVRTLMIIGSESNTFKGIADVRRALALLRSAGRDYRLIWVTPDEPQTPMGQVYVNPPQKQIGALLRQADIFVCASVYESFSLPVLEAMACGCAVVTTRNKGVLEYARDGQNCLMVDLSAPEQIAQKILELSNHEQLKNTVIQGGLETAANYRWARIIPMLIEYYRFIAMHKPQTPARQ